MSKKRILIAGLLTLIILAGRHEASAQICRPDVNQEILNTIKSQYGKREAPDINFKYSAQQPNLDGLERLGFEVSLWQDPNRDQDLVSYPYKVKRDTPAWRLHISMVGKYAVLQSLGTEDKESSGPLLAGSNLPRQVARPVIEQTQQIITWLKTNGYKVLGSDILSCQTHFTSLRGSVLNTYWQTLFRMNSPVPTASRGRPQGKPGRPQGRHGHRR